jgi:hypothetical protein
MQDTSTLVEFITETILDEAPTWSVSKCETENGVIIEATRHDSELLFIASVIVQDDESVTIMLHEADAVGIVGAGMLLVDANETTISLAVRMAINVIRDVGKM